MNEQQWHEWRRQGIGASDIGVLMGYSNYATPLDLYQIKVGEKQPEPSGWRRPKPRVGRDKPGSA